MIRSVTLTFFVLAVLLLFRSPVDAAERLALLIGNQKYNEKVGGLNNPRNDIKLVAEALQKLNFKITTIEDADFSTLQKAVRNHVAKIREAGADTINFFYYSGHGAADANTGLNYLIPVDVNDADDASLWINSVELKSDIIDKFGDQAPEASHFVIFDACRNELKLKNKDMKAIEVDGQGFVALQRPHFLIAYSTSAKRTASDAGVGSGAYARVLAEELVVPGVEAATAFRTVQLRIRSSIGQDPYTSIDGMPAIYLAGRDGSSQKHAELIVSPQAPAFAFERERESEKRTMKGLLQQIGDEGVPSGGAFYPEKKWSKKMLDICFLDGSQERRAYVASVARQWTLYGELDFDFGPLDDPRTCSPNTRHDVAITLAALGDWSFLGSDTAKVAPGNPTMSLQTVGQATPRDIQSGKFNREILHEFGHVLGFDHNWKVPTVGMSCDDEFDWDAIYTDLGKQGWTKQTVDANLRGKSSAKSLVGGFDKSSVMNYEFPVSYFKRGRDSPCYPVPLKELSLRDKMAMFKIYK